MGAHHRGKYCNADGSDTELGRAAHLKLPPVSDEMKKLGAITADLYSDWLVY